MVRPLELVVSHPVERAAIDRLIFVYLRLVPIIKTVADIIKHESRCRLKIVVDSPRYGANEPRFCIKTPSPIKINAKHNESTKKHLSTHKFMSYFSFLVLVQINKIDKIIVLVILRM